MELSTSDNVQKDILETRKAIIDKYKLLKRLKQDSEDHNKEKYKPIISALEKTGVKRTQTGEASTQVSEKKSRPFFLPISRRIIPNIEVVEPAGTPGVSDTLIKSETPNVQCPPIVSDTPLGSAGLAHFYATKDATNVALPATPRAGVEEMFESFDTPIAQVREEASTPAGKAVVDRYLEKVGDVASEYIKSLIDNNTKGFDSTYGIRFNGEQFSIGDSVITISDDFLDVEDTSYRLTEGLAELVFKDKPDSNKITPDDMTNYKEILETTNAHKKRYSSSEPLNVQMSNYKYKNIISKLFVNRPRSGRGECVNTIVERLKHLLENYDIKHQKEIEAIEKTLRKGGIIL